MSASTAASPRQTDAGARPNCLMSCSSRKPASSFCHGWPAPRSGDGEEDRHGIVAARFDLQGRADPFAEAAPAEAVRRQPPRPVEPTMAPISIPCSRLRSNSQAAVHPSGLW